VCADHSGVANAYVINPDKPGIMVAITNTIGGVTACVPSFDGRELALIEHDINGSYLACIANDRAHRWGQIQQITCPWPAPSSDGKPPRPVEPLPQGGSDPTAATTSP